MEKKVKFIKKNSDIFHKRKIWDLETCSAQTTEKIGIKIAQKMKKHKIKCAIFIGPFGAGKTTLIRGIIKELTGRDDVSSPSFTIVNEYRKGNNCVYHFDFYRIKNCDELESFGFREYLNKGFLLIEWPESAIEKLPEKSLRVFMEFIDFNSRRIKIIFP